MQYAQYQELQVARTPPAALLQSMAARSNLRGDGLSSTPANSNGPPPSLSSIPPSPTLRQTLRQQHAHTADPANPSRTFRRISDPITTYSDPANATVTSSALVAPPVEGTVSTSRMMSPVIVDNQANISLRMRQCKSTVFEFN
jgi:hypothetical protein